MKKLMTILSAIGLLGFASVACAPQSPAVVSAPNVEGLRVGTYNVHYIILGKKTGAWSVADWDRRKGPLDQAFKTMQADIVGFQEMESFGGGSGSDVNLTLDDLLANNPDFSAAAVGDPAVFPSTQPILYRRDKFTLLDQSWFFFSQTPDVIYSSTFNGSYPAFASMAHLQDKQTGKTLHVVNVHFEFKSSSNRQQSAALVASRIKPLLDAGENVLLLGDLNARAGAETQNILVQAGLSFLPVMGATYHLNRGLNLFGAIDHIGLSGGLTAAFAPVVLRQKFDGEWPTDHYPVFADILFR